jgi:hypothetical protein
MRTSGYVMREQAERIPDRVLLRFETETVTYGAYNQSVNRYADVIRRAGVARGAAVAIMMENSPDFLMAEGAMAKLGTIGALINTQLRGAALARAAHVDSHAAAGRYGLPAGRSGARTARGHDRLMRRQRPRRCAARRSARCPKRWRGRRPPSPTFPTSRWAT